MAGAYFRPHRLYTGLWAVVHSVPGMAHIAGAVAVDVECLNQAAAARLADDMNAERRLALQRQGTEQRLCGLRWDRPC